MACMKRAIQKQEMNPEVYAHLQGALQRTEDFMRYR